MKKGLKIALISAGSLVGLLLLAVILVPVLFKGKLETLAKDMANKNLNAVVDFAGVDISLIRNFPYLSVALDDLSVAGIGTFEGDTLASVKRIDASINLMSYISRGMIDIKVVGIRSPRVFARVAADSTANWDITKESAAEEDEDGESSGFSMKIKRFAIDNALVVYEDVPGKIAAGLDSLYFTLAGDLSDTRTVLNIAASCRNLTMAMDGTRWLSGVALALRSNVDADLKEMLFTLRETTLDVNRIALAVDGTVKMEQNDDLALDLTYAAHTSSLKTLLQMVPASLLPEVKDVDTRGTLALEGSVKGVYGKTSMPVVDALLKVDDGYIKYASLPKSINDITIDASAHYDGNDNSKSVVDLTRFHFELGSNPFDATARVLTPATDADMKASLKGKIDFASLRDALPLEGVDLSGIVTADIDFAGRMSAIEKQQYDRLNLNGMLGVQNFNAKVEDLPLPMKISEGHLNFTPRYVELRTLDCALGRSDIKASGRLDNFLGYALKKETLKGSLSLSSNLIDCNEILAGTGTETEKGESAPMSVIVLPSNVDFTMKAKVAKILYDNLTLTDASGGVGIKNGALVLDNFTTRFAGGTMALSGNYRAEDTSSAQTSMNMSLKKIDVKDLVSSFDMFAGVLPILGQMGGKVSLDFNFADRLDQNLNPVMAALSAVGSIQADSLRLVDTGTFDKIASLVGLKEGSNMLKNINASFSVHEGKVGIKPFNLKIGNTHMAIGGEYGLDKSVNAQIDLQIPTAKASSAVSGYLSSLGTLGAVAGSLAPKTVNVGIALGGTTQNMTMSLAKPKYLTSASTSSDTTATEDPAKQTLDDASKALQEKATDEATKQVGNAVNKVLDMFKKK